MALPQEVKRNIIKFMSHPCADLLRPIIKDFDSYQFVYRTFDEYCFEKVLQKINTEAPNTWTRDWLEERYYDMINDCHDEVEIGCLTWTPAEVLKQMDPVAYARGMDEYWEAEKENYAWDF